MWLRQPSPWQGMVRREYGGGQQFAVFHRLYGMVDEEEACSSMKVSSLIDKTGKKLRSLIRATISTTSGTCRGLVLPQVPLYLRWMAQGHLQGGALGRLNAATRSIPLWPRRNSRTQGIGGENPWRGRSGYHYARLIRTFMRLNGQRKSSSTRTDVNQIVRIRGTDGEGVVVLKRLVEL